MVQPNQQDPEFPPVERKYSRRMHGMSLRARNFGEKIKATLARSRARLIEIKTLIYCPGHASPWLPRSKGGYRLKCFYQTPRITVTDRSRVIYIYIYIFARSRTKTRIYALEARILLYISINESNLD